MTAVTLQSFAEALLTGINSRIENDYMVQSLGANPDFATVTTDAYRVPSVAAVKTALRAVAGAHLKIETLEGQFGAGKTYETLAALVQATTGAAPRTDTIYLQKDGPSDTTWTMYIYTVPEVGDPAWIDIGNTDLSFAEIESRLDALEATVGDATAGLVKKVADIESDLDPATAGGTGAKVAANEAAIGSLTYDENDASVVTGGTGLAKKVYDLEQGKVNVADMQALALGTIVADALAATPITTPSGD